MARDPLFWIATSVRLMQKDIARLQDIISLDKTTLNSDAREFYPSMPPGFHLPLHVERFSQYSVDYLADVPPSQDVLGCFESVLRELREDGDLHMDFQNADDKQYMYDDDGIPMIVADNSNAPISSYVRPADVLDAQPTQFAETLVRGAQVQLPLVLHDKADYQIAMTFPAENFPAQKNDVNYLREQPNANTDTGAESHMTANDDAFKEMFKIFIKESAAANEVIVKKAINPVFEAMHGIVDKVVTLHSRIAIMEDRTIARPPPVEVSDTFDELCKSLRSLKLKRYSFVCGLSDDQLDLLKKKRRKKGRKKDHKGFSEA